jgi:putative ABC transport system permease protein
MSAWSFIIASLRQHARLHLGLVLGSAVAAAVLVGAIQVGESVRAGLRQAAAQRLGRVHTAVLGGERWFTQVLAGKVGAVPVILSTGAVSATAGQVRVNAVQVLGVEAAFSQLSPGGRRWQVEPGQVLLNDSLAKKLQVQAGETVVITLERPSMLSRDAPLSGNTNEVTRLRRRVGSILTAADFGQFQLNASAPGTDTVWLPLAELQQELEKPGQVNALLKEAPGLTDAELESQKSLADLGLRLQAVRSDCPEWELSTERVFLDETISQSVLKQQPGSYPVITYLVNRLHSAKGSTPYSMVTAVERLFPAAADGGPSLSISQWLAEDQKLALGDEVSFSYYVVTQGRALREVESKAVVREILPMTDPRLNPAWTPAFAGVSDVANCRDWDPGMPMDLKSIRPVDERYWDDYRGTPKAFVRFSQGSRWWANRFGSCTAVRFPQTGDLAVLEQSLLKQLRLSQVGLQVKPVHEMAAAAAVGSVDFSGLLMALSQFVILAAWALALLLVLLSLEQRAVQVGVLQALGWSVKKVRRYWLGEVFLLLLLGTSVGLLLAPAYSHFMLRALVAQGLTPQLMPVSGWSAPALLTAGVAGALLLLLAWWFSRRSFQVPIILQMQEGGIAAEWVPERKRRRAWVWAVCFTLLAVWSLTQLRAAEPGAFFAAGFASLAAGLLWWRWFFFSSHMAAFSLAWQQLQRRPGRSLAVCGMMAVAVFLVVAVNAFHLEPTKNWQEHQSGTGGFALAGESTLPVYEDLNGAAGRESFSLDEEIMRDVTVVPFRVQGGDDASCLNLNRAQRPTLMAVVPEALQGRFQTKLGLGSAVFSGSGPGASALADEATALWGLQKQLGQSLRFTTAAAGEQEVFFRDFWLGSILQGQVLMSEADFLRWYPDAAGYRFFLIDCPAEKRAQVSAHLTRQLEGRGLALEPAEQRLARFQSVQNGYLVLFTWLGGLGVLLGTLGGSVLLVRHVLERRGELALMQAVGFSLGQIRRLVLLEHLWLLGTGVLLGAGCALLAVWPQLGQGQLPVAWLLAWLSGTFLFSLAACWVALRLCLQGSLVQALRQE